MKIILLILQVIRRHNRCSPFSTYPSPLEIPALQAILLEMQKEINVFYPALKAKALSISAKNCRLSLDLKRLSLA